jgi:hypothetical protein
VARGAQPAVVFDAVCRETGRLFEVSSVNLAHFASDGLNLTMAGWSIHDIHLPTDTLHGRSFVAVETAGPAVSRANTLMLSPSSSSATTK